MKSVPSLIVTLSALLAVLMLGGCGPISAQQITMVTPLPTDAPKSVVVAATAIEPSSTPIPTNVTVTPQTDQALPVATPTPLSIQLPEGSAAAIALATDVAMKPEIDAPIEFAEHPVPISFDEFYASFDMRGGLTLSEKLLSLDGQEVVIQGYMAPPLKPQLDWFVLTQIRLEFCPFCSTDADWPMDIAVIYLTERALVATQSPVQIRGIMEIGSSIDPETGMVSLVRIYARDVELLR